MALSTFRTAEQGSNESSASFAVEPSGYVLAKALAANTAEAFAVPANARFVLLSCDVDFYARFNEAASGTAAAVPTDTTDGSACAMNPAMRALRRGSAGIQEISVIAGAAAIVTAEFWS